MSGPAALARRQEALRAAARETPLGLYLHVPFCRDRCTYCSFATTRDTGLQAAAVDRLVTDVLAWGRELDRPPVDTLYLGGGTPSLLTAPELGRLTSALRAAFDLGPLAEATLEANPGTVDRSWLARARDLGWDRVSFGVQSLDDALLARLGRIHGGEQGLEALDLARRAGFERRSADLMVGIPGQALDRVLGDARTLAGTGLEHLSLYLLDLDKACPLKAEVEGGRLSLPSDDEVADVFEALQAGLPALGLAPYEISNYARPGAESRHNLRYWTRRPYLGLGPSAASHAGAWRWTESPVIPAWIEGRGEPEVQEMDAAEALAEIPLLGLRLHAGVDWEALGREAADRNLAPLFDAWTRALDRFEGGGLVAREGPRRRLTARGMLLSNGILQTFVGG
ncbi:MAG: radical SAM family heme chaperone HemW [Holophagaceae bacterium]